MSNYEKQQFNHYFKEFCKKYDLVKITYYVYIPYNYIFRCVTTKFHKAKHKADSINGKVIAVITAYNYLTNKHRKRKLIFKEMNGGFIIYG